jgi:hypothetical protein
MMLILDKSPHTCDIIQGNILSLIMIRFALHKQHASSVRSVGLDFLASGDL